MSYCMVDLIIHSKNPFFFNFESDFFVCQQWCQPAFSKTQWGTILKCSRKIKSPFLRFVHFPSTSTLLPNYLINVINADQQRGNIKGIPAWWKVKHHYQQYQSLFEVNFRNSVAVIIRKPLQLYHFEEIKWCLPIFQSIQLTLRSSLWSNYQVSQTHNETTPQIFYIRRSYRGSTQERCRPFSQLDPRTR